MGDNILRTELTKEINSLSLERDELKSKVAELERLQAT